MEEMRALLAYRLMSDHFLFLLVHKQRRPLLEPGLGNTISQRFQTGGHILLRLKMGLV